VDPTEDEVTKAAQTAPEDPAAPRASYRLTVVEGLDAGRELRIDGREPSRVLVGKGPTADLKLVDPAVSRRHLALEIERGPLRVTDLGSTNGTRVDDTEVADAYVRGGEAVRIGSTVLRVERLGGDSVPAPSPPAGDGRSGFARLIGGSASMRKLYPLCERLA